MRTLFKCFGTTNTKLSQTGPAVQETNKKKKRENKEGKSQFKLYYEQYIVITK